jgi:formylglycine-generating enzyme required for sulfatase activity
MLRSYQEHNRVSQRVEAAPAGSVVAFVPMARAAACLLVLLFILVSCPTGGEDPGDTPPSASRELVPVVAPGETVTVHGSGEEGVFVAGRTVSLGPFAIAKYEITWELWTEVRDWALGNGYRIANRGTGLSEESPVTDISWRDAIVWCNAYSEMGGLEPVYCDASGEALRESLDNAAAPGITSPADRALMALDHDGYRLPLEAEWEFTARNDSPGLFAMNGDIAEWCWDWFHEDGITAGTPVTGDGPGEFAHRVIRGGGWSEALDKAYITNRNYFRPFSSSPKIGFRVARSL